VVLAMMLLRGRKTLQAAAPVRKAA